ncbi:MAG: glycerophosphodiester phosphodiesterase [Flavisolibacter sp.]
MLFKKFFILSVCVWAISCSKNEITPPPDATHNNLDGTSFVNLSVAKGLEGIYQLKSGSNALGSQFVCKISKTKVSFFGDASGLFFILSYGFKPSDSSIQFGGFWRISESTTQSIIQLSIAAKDGASDLMNNRVPATIELKGSFIDKNGTTQSIDLVFSRKFSDYVRTHEFVIFAHHGVLTTANPPYAQNSLNGVLHDQDYGVDGLEFDVRLTKDHVPICIHNPGIDILLTKKSPLSGEYIQYSFEFLENYIELIDGQRIPSVEQVLRAFIDSTTMKYMWLDIKGDPDIFKYLEPVVRNAYAHATAKGRTVEIIADIPTKDVIDQYKSWPNYSDLPTMCELSLQDAIDLKSVYFGPRYTLGLLTEDVNKAHSMGMKVYSWTLNSHSLITNYLQNGNFDGFISDYPAYVVYDYYTMH